MVKAGAENLADWPLKLCGGRGLPVNVAVALPALDAACGGAAELCRRCVRCRGGDALVQRGALRAVEGAACGEGGKAKGMGVECDGVRCAVGG